MAGSILSLLGILYPCGLAGVIDALDYWMPGPCPEPWLPVSPVPSRALLGPSPPT